MNVWDKIAEDIGAATGQPFAIDDQRGVGGGCINDATRVHGGGRSYFVKLNSADQLDMFEAEAEGLAEMAAAKAVRVPEPVCYGTAGSQAYLVMEDLDLGGHESGELLGRQLAQMHRTTRPRFGWHRDNTIGSTPQINTPSDDWVEFWREHRLGFQLELAARHGHGGALQKSGERLMGEMGALFTDHQPEASLLHGDLWSGNYAATGAGEPVIFDPATYYGDREADIAMTELFGGFSHAFYSAYNEAWPLDAGYKVRKVFYNLYHILNHLNLFGGGYAGQAGRMIDQLLAELR